MARSYPFLRFAKGVDWKDVNPKLLSALNLLGSSQHKIIDIISGFRTYEQQADLYQRYVSSGYDRSRIAAKPGESNHEHGAAVDALINGKPIAKVLKASVLARFGLVNPVRGDFPHTELIDGAKVPSQPQVSAPPATSNQPTTDQSMVTVAAPNTPDPSAIPPTQPEPLAPGTLPAGALSPHSLWAQVVASSPSPSEESQLFLQNAQSANG